LLFDVLDAEHLPRIGEAIQTLVDAKAPAFVIGSSGIECALTAFWSKLGGLESQRSEVAIRPTFAGTDKMIAITGSCSPVNARQIAWAEQHGFELIALDPARLIMPEKSESEIAAAVELALKRIRSGANVILGRSAHQVVPQLQPDTSVVTLDPASAHAGDLPTRNDISYFVTHPCHSSVFDHYETTAERDDFFGGVHPRQAIVCALMHGPDKHYDLAESLAKEFYGPVTRSHCITMEQMAILEPTMAETCGIALIRALREVMEEAVRRGATKCLNSITLLCPELLLPFAAVSNLIVASASFSCAFG